MESPRLSARRAVLYGLHVSVVFAGLVALLTWLAFRNRASACVAGGAWIAGGLLALVSRRSPTSGITHRIAARGGLLQVYVAALLAFGGLLLRAGVHAE